MSSEASETKLAPLSLVCPKTTAELVDVCWKFTCIFNESEDIQLYSYQEIFGRRVIQSILLRDGATITALFARQSGKSEVVACIVCALCVLLPALAKAFPDDKRLRLYRKGFHVGIYAPKLPQAVIIFGRVRNRAETPAARAFYADPDIGVSVKVSRGEEIAWSNGSFVVAQTASEQSNNEGRTYQFVVIDEAQLVSATKVEKEISPMLINTAGTLVQIGTAHITHGGFRRVIEYNEREQQLPGGVRNHFEVPYDVVIQEKRAKFEETGIEKHLLYEKGVNNELKKIGGNIDNPAFSMNYRLLWRNADVGAIPYESLEAMKNPDRRINQPTALTKRCRHAAGIDFAKAIDATVLTIYEELGEEELIVLEDGSSVTARRWEIVGIYLIDEGTLWQQRLKHAVRIIAQYNVVVLVGDGTGLGGPLMEQLITMLPRVKCFPYVFNQSTGDALFRYYIQEIEAQRITVCAQGLEEYEAEQRMVGEEASDTVDADMTTLSTFFHEHTIILEIPQGRYMKYAAPEGQHDDHADSAALGCWATKLMPEDGDMEVVNDFSIVNSDVQNMQRLMSGSSRSDRYRSSRF